MSLMTEITGKPKTTLKHTCGDTVETLVADVTGYLNQYTSTVNNTKQNVAAVLITCETNDIRFSWGADATQAGLGHVLAAGQSIKLTNHAQIEDFRFINKTNGSNAVLQITPELSSTS